MGTVQATGGRAAVLPSERVLAAVASLGLHDDGTLAAARLSDDDFATLIRLSESHRLLGALAEAVATGALAVSPDQLALVIGYHNRWLSNALLTEAMLLRVDDCFAAHHIDYRVLKGVALSHVAYDDPSWRVYSDLDILVRSADFVRAIAALCQDLGGDRLVPELRPGFDLEFGREATVHVGGREIDLHRTLVDGAFGLTVDLDDLFAEPTWFEVAGRRFPALGGTPAVLHACYDVALGDHPVRLSALRDLLLLHSKGFDFDAVTSMARRWRGEAVVERAAHLATDTLALPCEHGLHAYAALGSTRQQRWLLRSYGGRPGPYATHLAAIAVIPGVRRRLRYVRAITRPSPEYLASRGWTRRGHMRRALRQFAGRNTRGG